MSDLHHVSSALHVNVTRIDAPNNEPDMLSYLLASIPPQAMVSVWSGPAIAGDSQPTIVGSGAAVAFIVSQGHGNRAVEVDMLREPSYEELLQRLEPQPIRAGSTVAQQPHMEAVGRQWCTFAHNCTGTDSLAARDLEARTGIRLPVGLMSFGFGPHSPGVVIAPQRSWIEYEGSLWLVELGQDEYVPRSRAEQHYHLQPPAGLSLDPGTMSRSTWAQAVSDVVERLARGDAQKAVMARDVSVMATSPIDARYLCDRLSNAYPTCWIFSVAGLTGASPEMLASVRDGVIKSRVLAGTCAPGEGHALLESAKDREEHMLAVQSVTEALDPITSAMQSSRQPFLLDLPNVSHLATDVRAMLDPSLTGSAPVCLVVSALHPTAAVGGTPTQKAYQILTHHELTDRGRYSGPVGWIDAMGDGACAIALRCGQISGDRYSIRVLAGGGIMPDSDPDLEVAETQAKMRPVLQALGIDG
ncbi:MAG: chorismate-binding protein [Actinomycetaceae bacterium]|nr:chorismate-binding protein [Actinomycetaceae bacterium]